MEKVVLTAEQAESIERYLNDVCPNKEKLLRKQSEGVWYDPRNTPMNALSLECMAKALYIGYEIEKPKFQPGDKVIRRSSNKIHTLHSKRDMPIVFGTTKVWNVGEGHTWIGESEFRHATPEEIYWLETLGRDKVRELRKGDVIAYSNAEPAKVNIPEFWTEHKFTNVTGIYPADSFKPFPKEATK